MTVSEWLKQAVHILNKAEIGTARLDALVLLEDVLGVDRAKILAEPETKITEVQVAKLKKLLNARKKHIPLAYVRGKTEFYRRDFVVTPAVLEPRPESETMIDLLQKLPAFSSLADVGAGSGALGITAKILYPEARVDLLEIDPSAIKIAEKNARLIGVRVGIAKTDILEGSSLDYDVLLCNLPYVPDNFQINQAAGNEPKIAIFGGSDGLNIYRQLFKQIDALSLKPKFILTESLPPQHEILAQIALESGYKQSAEEDFIQLFIFS